MKTINHHIKALTPMLGICLFITSPLSLAEPVRYEGNFGKRKVGALLEWTEGDRVTGVLSPNDEPTKKLMISGSNSSKGVMKIQLSEGAMILGTSVLSKTTTAGSIIWSGEFRFSNGDKTIIEFRRVRETTN